MTNFLLTPLPVFPRGLVLESVSRNVRYISVIPLTSFFRDALGISLSSRTPPEVWTSVVSTFHRTGPLPPVSKCVSKLVLTQPYAVDGIQELINMLQRLRIYSAPHTIDL